MHSVHLRSGVLWLMEPWGPPQLCNYAIASGAMKQGMAEMSEVAREAAEAAQAMFAVPVAANRVTNM